MSSRHRVYAYGPQQRAAQSFLDQCNLFPSGRMQCVNNRWHLAGLDYGTLLVVKGHPSPIPDDIMREAAHRGFVVFELDDAFARAKAARRVMTKPSKNAASWMTA